MPKADRADLAAAIDVLTAEGESTLAAELTRLVALRDAQIGDAVLGTCGLSALVDVAPADGQLAHALGAAADVLRGSMDARIATLAARLDGIAARLWAGAWGVL